MADILTLDLSRVHDPGNFDFVYQEEETEDMAAEEVDPLSDEFSPEDSFPPLRRILTYYKSDKNDDRHLCLRLFPDALQCMTTMTELNMLLQVVFTLAKDHFHIIRIGLLSNLPSLLEKNKEFALGEEEIAAENRQQLLNILIRLLADSEVEVRRVGHNILGMCISGEADPGRVEELMERLFPVVKRFLGRDENYDLRIDVAMLISKLSSLLGQANVLKYFLPLLADLSTDTMFHVRKAFAVSCREMCAVLEEAMVEQHILPLYLPLCKDEVWGVRKACADVFSDISISCNLGTRYDLLTPVFLKLLHDDSRWVRKAAYQSLGAFIATFYIPNGGNESAATEGAQEGEGEGDESTLGLLSDSLLQDNSLLGSPSTSTTSDPTCAGRHPSPNTTPPIDDGVISNSSTPIHNNHNHTTTTTNINTTTTTQATTVASVADAANPEFNNFEFWRSPIPSVEDREKSKLSEQPGEGSGVVGKLDFEGVSSAEERCSIEASPCLAVAGEVLEEQGSSEAKAAQAGTEGSGEEEEKGEGGSGSGEGSDQVEALASERAEKAEEWVEAANCEVDASVIPPAEPANRSNMSAPTVVTAVNSSSSGPPSAPAAGSLGPVVLRGRVSGSPAVRRVSMDQSLMSPPNKRILHEKKRRRWSLNAPNHTNLPQVRVFVHSVSGQVTEQEVSPTPDDVVEQEKRELSMSAEMAQTMCEDSEGGNGGGELSMADASLAHDVTITKSVAMDLTFEPTNNKFEEEPYVDQEIVPDELMEIYLSMTEHSRVQTVDTDLLYYCAYSLPGVTLTLGKKHWELLKPTFDYLVEDLQWKIRRVLSFSLHELARVLGTDITCRDILPIFEEYCTKDVDDVKIGVLSHLAEFFELIPDPLREKCLPMVLEGLLQMENQRNWRYRLTLVEQLLLLCELFESEFLHQHIYPLALILSEDKVAEVRSSAGFLIGTLLQRIGESGSTVSHTLLQRLRSSLVDHPNWLHRLMFVKQCETFLLNRHISYEVFSRECLPSILLLARDKVPNIRIAIAKLLKDSIMQCEYFQHENEGSFSLEELQITLECLQHDKDRDVKFFAGGEVLDTPRSMAFPQQWYSRVRSESHASSDLDQYQDASDVLTLEMSKSLPLPPSSQFITSTTTVELLNTGHTPSFNSTPYHSHPPSEFLSTTSGPAISSSSESSSDQILEALPDDSAVITVAKEVEVLCEEMEGLLSHQVESFGSSQDARDFPAEEHREPRQNGTKPNEG